MWAGAAVVLALMAGCAHFNTFYNAQKAFNDAERIREDRLKSGEDVLKPAGNQKTEYETAFKKAQKILDEYPGHSLTDDALFLQGKASQRLNNYRTSITKLNLLFQNFPQTPYLEEALYLQAVNYLLVGDAAHSQDMLTRLEKSYPESKFQAEALRTSGDSAYSLEDWAEAVSSYRDYLDRFPDTEDADEIGQRLGESYWELERYDEAADVLRGVVATTTSREHAFKARLLLAKCLVKLEKPDEAQALIDELRDEAEIYQRQGDVLVVEAANLVARGKDADAIALLENMPSEWGNSPEVKGHAADMLGYLYLHENELEEARAKFQVAVPTGKQLDDYEHSKQLLSTIQNYLAAENALPDADPQRAARLRLLEANGQLFGFDRPRRALDLYTTVAADSAADSTSAARALYGAMLVYRDRLDDPDSSRIYADRLVASYPESPQAYQVKQGNDADLLAFLQAKVEARREQDQERSVVETVEQPGQGVATGSGASAGGGLRRRKVFLQRRDNLIFPPPAEALRQSPTPPPRRDEALETAPPAASTPFETTSPDSVPADSTRTSGGF